MAATLTRTCILAGLCVIPPPPDAIAQVTPPLAAEAQASDLLTQLDAILDLERGKLGDLARRLRAEGKELEAGRVDALVARDASEPGGPSTFRPLPEVVPAGVRALASVEVNRPELSAAREAAAKALFELANRAARAPSPAYALADRCLRLVLERQPDHAEARRLLGFVAFEGGWATPYAAEKRAKGAVLDPAFGWVPGDWVPRLAKGELPAPGNDPRRWLPAAEADALRKDFDRPWQISTEHFQIRTNVPLKDAIAFGRQLEQLHELFFAVLADVLGPDQLPLAQRFKNPKLRPSVSSRSSQVSYFATRDEYARHLAPFLDEGSRTSLGTYVPRKESKPFGARSYFFNDVGGQLDVTATLFHEASHQILFESAGPDDYARNVGNYWVFEGLGTYFETLRILPDGRLEIGALQGPRIEVARKRILDGREFIPIEQLVSLGGDRFKGDQGPGDIYLRYAESMALTIFLMQAERERYREGFLDYVRDAYKGRFRGGAGKSLEARLGVRYAELDRAFLAYLRAGR